MIKRKTVLVLGAGASKPYGFPTGRQLLFKLDQELRRGNTIFTHLKDLGFREPDILQFQGALKGSGLPSVDTFLERRTEFLNVGRAALAIALIPYEQPDNLVRTEKERGLYEYIFQHIACNISKFEENELTIISFNYDRSLEHSLYTNIESCYGAKPEVAMSLLNTIPIIHVYGTLGNFDPTKMSGRAFSPECDGDAIRTARDGIKIMGEGVFDTEDLKSAKEAIAESEITCFLGFGYNETNVRRLGLPNDQCRQPFGTAYGLKTDDMLRIKTLIKDIHLGTETDDSVGYLQATALLKWATGEANSFSRKQIRQVSF